MALPAFVVTLVVLLSQYPIPNSLCSYGFQLGFDCVQDFLGFSEVELIEVARLPDLMPEHEQHRPDAFGLGFLREFSLYLLWRAGIGIIWPERNQARDVL